MADLVKLKTGKIDKLASVDQDNKPVVPLEAGNVYFAVDTTTHKGKIVYDAPNGTSVDRIVMSTDAERADSADKALTADKAVTLVAARNIDGINFNGSANVIHYTTCATNASKVEKIVTINGFALISGARISVRFANTNSANNPTLNVSGTGAKPILYNGTNIPTAYLTNNKVWDFIYDGNLDAWIFVGDKNIDTNTTYTEATATKSGLMSASDKTKLDTIQSGAKVVNYESHLASGVKIGTITIGGTATDIFSTPDTWTAFKGATADAAGSAGYIGNAPAAGKQNAFFTGAGTWKTLTVADDKNNGLMSSNDRTKLDSIESNANYTYLNAVAPISVNKHVGTITISHNASGATAGTYGTNSSTALTPGFGENFSVTGFQINATGHVTSASNHNVKMPDTLVDDTHRGLMSSDMYLAWNKGITLAGHQLLLGSAWSKTDFLDTLGLTNALRWIGNATVAIADGSKTDPKITGYDFSKAKPGDVVLDKDNKREYAWTLAGAWESLGPDGDLATADHRHANATSTTDGFMSADDKAKLDTVESKANYIYVSANAPISVNKHVGALTITHNTSGVTAGAYGDAVAQAPGFGASFLVPNLTVNATGHVTVAGAHTVTIPNALVTDKTNGLMSADDKARFDIIKDGYYVKRAGDTMTGALGLVGDKCYGPAGYGMNCNNSDIVGINGLFTRDNAESFGEGLNFYRSSTTWDSMTASNGTFYFGSNVAIDTGLTGSASIVAGAATFNGTLHTTGATTLDSTLSVGGTATMKGALNVNGAATIGSNLTVAGTSTLNGPLVTNGTVTFNNGFFNYAGIGLAESDAFRNVWFSEATHRGQPVYNDNFVYNPHTAQLWIKSTADASSTTKTGALIIGADNGDQIAIDGNEILARSKSTAGTLYLQYEGGGIETWAIIYNGNGTDATTTTSGSIHTDGGVGIGKQLRVGGATNLGSSLTVASGTSIGGSLSVGAAATLASTLMVNGATTHKATVTFANNTPNIVGDDVQIGDFNRGGTLGIQGLNGTTAISLLAKGATWGSGSDRGTLSYDGSNLILDKRIKVPSVGGAWLAGKTIGNASINITTDITKDSYYPLLAVKNYNNNVWNIGGINNIVGFFGYYANRTENGIDYSTVWDLRSGKITHSGALEVGNATTLKNTLNVSGATVINNSLTTTGTTVLNNMSSLTRTYVTSGTSSGLRTSLLIYGGTYGNDAAYLAKAGQFSYGDPGPQIIFNTVNNLTSGQPLALIYTDNDTISPGVSLSLVSNQSDAWFIAPHIKALSGFTGELTGNASSATQLKTARALQTDLASDSANNFDGSADCTMGVTGILPVKHGGTGATTFATGYALIGNGTSAVQTRQIKNITSVNALGWTSGDTSLINSNTLAYWNGAYADTNSNILYTAVGQLGDVATVNKNGSITKFLRGDGNWAGVAQLVHQEKTIATTDWVESSLTTNGITYPYCYSFDATGVTADDTIAWLEITSGKQTGDMLISTGTAKISIYTTSEPDTEIGIKAWYIGEGVEGDATLTQYEQLAQKVENTMKGAMLFFAGATSPADTSGRTAWLDTANNRLKFYWDGAWRAVNTYQ